VKKRLTPAQQKALALLREHNLEGAIQTGTGGVVIHGTKVSNQTLLALRRLDLAFCIHLITKAEMAGPRRPPKERRRRWHAHTDESLENL
jgi:hypothetical protein